MLQEVETLLLTRQEEERAGHEKGGGVVGASQQDKGGGDRFSKLLVLLKIATRCQSLLNVVSEEVLKIGNVWAWLQLGAHYLELAPSFQRRWRG